MTGYRRELHHPREERSVSRCIFFLYWSIRHPFEVLSSVIHSFQAFVLRGVLFGGPESDLAKLRRRRSWRDGGPWGFPD